MHTFFTTVGLVFFTLIFGNPHHSPHTQVITPTPVVHEITATGSVTEYGQTVTFSFSFPEKGGKVNGTIGGACNGNIQGNYSGGQKGALVGNSKASCSILFTTFTGNISFDSHVDIEGNSLSLPVHIVAEGKTEDISISLSLSH